MVSEVFEDLFGQDDKISECINQAKTYGSSKVPVLICGEVGVGKKSLGQLIHEHSARKMNPFLVLDCHENQEIEKKILGHRDEVSGRFQKGILERGHGGTVVLSNIDCVDENFQKKLFKIISELSDYELDIRFIFTTTKNISKLVGIGRFYRSLYLFFQQNQIFIPPLRDRKNDILFIMENFIHHVFQDRLDDKPTLDNFAKQKVISHYFSQNTAELFSILGRSIENCHEKIIRVEDLIMGEKKVNNIPVDNDEEGLKLMSLKDAERLLIKKALIHTSENRTQAAKILGVSIRTLRNKINEYRNEGSNYFIGLR
jgi:two-component system response regulator FlrC